MNYSISKYCLICVLAILGCSASAQAKSILELKQQTKEENRIGVQRQHKKVLSRTPSSLISKAPVMTPMKIPGSNTVLCGALVYDDSWADINNEITAGIYTFPVRSDATMTAVYKDKNFMKMRAGVKVNNDYYVISASSDGSRAYFDKFSAITWTHYSNSEIEVSAIPTDLAYDPVTKKIYGFFWNETDCEYNRFCSFDPSLGLETEITISEREMHACAVDKNGVLYSVSSTGRFYIVDKTTGRLTSIGGSGIYPKYVNSMTFDTATNKLYWAATLDDDSAAIYEINTTNAKATKIVSLGQNAGFSGVFAMPLTIPKTAPEAVTDIKVNYTTQGALTGTITFTAPTKKMDGSDLTSPISAIIELNGQQYVVSDIQPGATATSETLTFKKGQQEFTITTADDENQGNSATATTWAGEDIPGLVTNLVLSEKDGLPHLTWEAPAAGMNGGYYDANNLAYKIVRYPDVTTVAEKCTETSFTDVSAGTSQRSLYYAVYAYNESGSSDAVNSNKYVFGDGYSVPFTETFDNQDAFDLWTVVDNNGATTWTYNASGKNAVYTYDEGKKAADDWFISPKIYMTAGVNYSLSFLSKVAYARYKESFKVCLGKTQTPSDLTTVLVDCPEYDNATGETQTASFTVPESGYYYIGFYAYSQPYMWKLYIDDISVTTVDSSVPNVVTDITATAGEKGAMNATLTFVAPTVNINDESLSAISKIDIYRNNETTPATSMLEVEPGARYTWTDNNITTAGTYIYTIIAHNAKGAGTPAKASVFVGVDKPGAVLNAKLVDNNGAGVLTWEKPTKGSNGGYFDDLNLTYRVLRIDGEVVASDIKECTFTDNTINATKQEFVYYVITPYCGTTKGDYAVTNGVIFGTPYAAPLTESFSNAGMNNYPWVAESDGAMNESWTLDEQGYYPAVADQDGNKGLATFHSYGESAGIHAWLTSPKIDISKLESPVLNFWMYHSSVDTIKTNETLEVRIAQDGGEPTTLNNATFKRDNGTTGWTRYSLALSDYKNTSYVQLSFRGTTDAGLNIYIDNISVTSGCENDLEATSIEGPKKMALGESMTYSVKVTNVGSTAYDNYSVELSDGTNVIATAAGASLAPNAVTIVPLTAKIAKVGTYDITAKVVCSDDQNMENNACSMKTNVVEPVIPVPYNLAGTNNVGTVTLTWSNPADKGAVTDDVESYQDFAIDNIGDWTMVDNDKLPTYYINNKVDYDNASTPKAFQVCNANTLQINVWDEGTPHSGDKFFMSMASSGGQNDDWLISPLLNGTSQSISFFAKSFTEQAGIERMRVLYSTTDTDPAHFTQLHTDKYIEVPEMWTEYQYQLPEGARYFAVNCVSNDAFALFVDDLSFNDTSVPQLKLTGYEIYRDGEKIGTSKTETFVDNTYDDSKSVAYTVKAIYDKAESGMSEAVTVGASAVDAVSGDSFTVYAQNGCIVIVNACGKAVEIFTADGMKGYDGVVSSELEKVQAEQGLYLVRIDGKVTKVLVK